MKFKNILLKKILLGFVFLTVFCFFGCRSAVKSGKAVNDPFPVAMIGHTTFKVFQSGTAKTFLGRVFRDEKNQVLGEQYWAGNMLGGGGQRREIEYSKKQAFSINTRMPKVKLKVGLGFQTNVSLVLVLIGLKTHQLTRPVLNTDFRGTEESKNTRFIVSLLMADEIIMRVQDDSGGVIGIEAQVNKVFADAKYSYSKKHKGVILAKNSIIGYMLTKPKQSDLNRK